MLLAIDVGNTNVVLGCVSEDGQIGSMSRMTTDKTHTADEYAIKIKDILDLRGINVADITDCIISSVVPPVTGTLRQAVEFITGKAPMVIGPGLKTGLDIRIDSPAQLGADLAVDAVAVVNQYDLPAVVIDMGTATTFSVIDVGAKFLGGLIMPGMRTSLAALSSGTAQLPNVGIDKPTKLIGTNTIDCMISGVVMGHASMIDGIVDRVEEELGKKVTVVATGGHSSLVMNYCKHEIIFDDHLLLKGLYFIYKKNKK